MLRYYWTIFWTILVSVLYATNVWANGDSSTHIAHVGANNHSPLHHSPPPRSPQPSTKRMHVEMQNGVVTRLVNPWTGEAFAVKIAPPLTGIRHQQSGDLWNDRAQVEQKAAGPEVTTILRWREQNGVNVLNTRLRVLPEGEAVVLQQAKCARSGLVGIQWGIAVPDDWDLLVPAHSGLRFSKESDYHPRQFHYPMEWEAQFVLIQASEGESSSTRRTTHNASNGSSCNGVRGSTG